MGTVRMFALTKLLPLLAAATVLAACNDNGSTGGAATSASTTTTVGNTATTGGSTTGGTPTTPAAPTISGSAPTSVIAGQTYSFRPLTTDPSGGVLSFSISNKPAWASFNTATGLLSGEPTAAEVATYSNITISVSTGQVSASMAPFAIVVAAAAATTGSATLTWEAPQDNTNGSPLTDLSGYTIYYGTNSAELTQTVKITNPTQTSYVINNLSAGTYYFSVAADASDGTQSTQSILGSKTII
jgi:hypothetical protein